VLHSRTKYYRQSCLFECKIYRHHLDAFRTRIIKERIEQGLVIVSEQLKTRVAACKKKSVKIMVLTMHRRESFDGGIKRVLQTVRTFLQEHEDLVCFYPFHPNPYVVHILQEVRLSDLANCYVLEPLAYQNLVYLLDNADFVLTDSGGIQEEAISLGKPVLVLREKTERQEGVQCGLAELVGTDVKLVINGLNRLYKGTFSAKPSRIYGDGDAADKIVEILQTRLEKVGKLPFKEIKPIKQPPLVKQRTLVMTKKVSILGLGYIGLPTAIVCAQAGFRVEGFDIDVERVSAINKGDPVIHEPDLTEKLQATLRSHAFVAVTELSASDYFVIAVPTPFQKDKKADLSHVMTAAATIATVLATGNTVILESTVPVGTTDKLAIFLQDKTGLVAGVDFYIAYCPERVLPGEIFKELIENDRVLGGINTASVYAAQDLYKGFVTGAIYLTNTKSAEMIKLIENSSRDVQIAFAHQVASMAYAVGLDPYEIIEIANKHPRVNILKPSCGVGGHCIAVDPWFLIETFPAQTALLQSARSVNDARPLQIVEYIYKAIRAWQVKHARRCTVLLMGQTYKPDVDDVRESSAVRIAHMVKEHGGIRMLVCEPHLNQHKMQALYGDAAVQVSEGLEQADIVVFLVGHTRFKAIDKKILAQKQVLDFSGLRNTAQEHDAQQLYWPAKSAAFFQQDEYGYNEEYQSQELG
jgi:UDP-N-acetyl-D-mannosaminuronic acid dehydrogenase